jgi:glycosyltransferase involved in cell wall biosynthesis
MAYPGTSLAQEVEGAGLVIPPGDVRALVSAIRDLLDNPVLRRSLGDTGRTRALSRWDKTTILSALEQALATFKMHAKAIRTREAPRLYSPKRSTELAFCVLDPPSTTMSSTGIDMNNNLSKSDCTTHSDGKLDLTVVILTFNEAIHIERALNSVSRIARHVFVIDSHSTDSTVEIAMANGATVLQNKFVNQAKQFQWALANAPICTEWVMRLDADEVVEDDLATEIQRRLPGLLSDVVGINLKRKHIFMDRWIRHGGRYPLLLLRIWRHGKGQIEDRWMDEHVVVSGGHTTTFEGRFSDHNLSDLTAFVQKHNKYATREAIDVLNQRHHLFPGSEPMRATNTSLQASVKRWLKEHIYNRIPFQISACLYFLLRYVVQLGFLDGREGLIYHFLQGFWYRFLVGAKILELERAIAPLSDVQTKKSELARRTGLKIDG